MDSASTLDTVDTDEAVVAVARRHLGSDGRVRFHVMDGAEFLRGSQPGQFDLIYADAWTGKFSQLDEALALLRPGGIYLIDDLLPKQTGRMVTRRRCRCSSRTSSAATGSQR
jgi:predicted O-methyltransferase YrrM